jgi:hypothetical protein
MKLSVLALAPVVAVFSAYAAGPIEWSKDFTLTQQHFKGAVPRTATDAAHSFVALDVAWECRQGDASSRALATFDPDQSWWNAGAPNIWGGIGDGLSRSQIDNRRSAADRDRDLLRHEQLHFDLTELTARTIRRLFDDLPRVCRTPGSNTAMEKSVAAAERAWADEQAAYDRDTVHGTNLVAQRKWERRVQRELER